MKQALACLIFNATWAMLTVRIQWSIWNLRTNKQASLSQRRSRRLRGDRRAPMNTLITGLALFALGVGVSVLILIWHKYRIQRRIVRDRVMWKARANKISNTGGNHEDTQTVR